MDRPRVLHVINGLASGGTELTLLKLLRAGLADRFDSRVISLRSKGWVGEAIESAGVPVQTLGMSSSFSLPFARSVLQLIGRTYQPDLVQGWLYQGNLAALAVASGCQQTTGKRPPVLWGVRQTPAPELRRVPWGQRLILRWSGYRASRVQGVIYNSEASRRRHRELGFDAAASDHVLPNGFDLERFRSDPQARQRIRDELGLGPGSVLIGAFGRLHEDKDLPNFLSAAALLAPQAPEAVFVLAGRGVVPGARTLGAARRPPLPGRVRLLGERQDMPALHAALDILALPSAAESFPNVLGEAMASAVPAVATDVGDCAEVLRDPARIVPPKDPQALADALLPLIRDHKLRQRLGREGRERAEQEYSLQVAVERFAALYEERMNDDS
ncbi:MAG: glycosyltransferase [Acidobacteriota bacterium]